MVCQGRCDRRRPVVALVLMGKTAAPDRRRVSPGQAHRAGRLRGPYSGIPGARRDRRGCCTASMTRSTAAMPSWADPPAAMAALNASVKYYRRILPGGLHGGLLHGAKAMNAATDGIADRIQEFQSARPASLNPPWWHRIRTRQRRGRDEQHRKQSADWCILDIDAASPR